MKRFFLLFAFFTALWPAFVAEAQTPIAENFKVYSEYLSPEKLYLHTDRDSYCIGDTIWLKGYLLNNSLFCSHPESNYIYVELLGYDYEKNFFSGRVEETQKIVKRVKIKRRGGILQGYIAIPDEMVSGQAILRAYTYWNLNFPVEYMFAKNLHITNPVKDDYVQKLVKNRVKVKDEYTRIGVKYPFDNKKVKQDVDCQFFAESGKMLFPTKHSVIAFKAIAEDGLGVRVKGVVCNALGDTLARFASNELGFGKFKIPTPAPDESLTAFLEDEREIVKKVNLPKSSAEGAAIHIENREDDFLLRITLRKAVGQRPLRLIVCDGSELFYNTEATDSLKILLPKNKMPSGIIQAAIADESGNVYASRQFFVMPSKAPRLTLTQDKEKLGSREMAHLTVALEADNENVISGDFSISITDDNLSPLSCKENNIVSYMLLKGELGGYIEAPQSYFDPSIPLKEREENIDLLMLTQGWRYYDTEQILKAAYKMPTFGKEYIQTVTGRVKATRRQKSALVSFVAPSIKFSAIGQLDSSGFFELKGLNFPDSTLFIVNAVGAVGGSRRAFVPYIDEDSFAPKADYYRRPDTLRPDDNALQQMLQRYYATGGTLVYQLDPVYVIARRTETAMENPSPLPGAQSYKKGQLREGAALEPFRGYDLMTYLYETCQGLRVSVDATTGEKILLCRGPRRSTMMSMEDNWIEVAAFINGFAVSSTADLNAYMMTDVLSVVYLTGIDAAPYAPLISGSALNRSVILIKTNVNSITGMPKNVTKGYALGWQKPKQIYTPVYDYKSKAPAMGQDKRSTIYWNPALRLSSGESSVVEFYTSDGRSSYTAVIEGITQSGEFVYQKFAIKR